MIDINSPRALLAELAYDAAVEGMFPHRRRGRPGERIEKLSEKDRERLRQLRSDDISEMFFVDKG